MMQWRDGCGSSELRSTKGQARSVVDITAWRQGNLQIKWCVRPVNGVRVRLNIWVTYGVYDAC